MNLVLWRHADAIDAAAGQTDHERTLTDKGRQQAKRMAAWLNERLPANIVVMASPAVRAQQTAAALKRAFVTSESLNTDTDGATLLKAVSKLRPQGTVVIVGHQPTLGHVASLLLTGAEGELSIKKGAVWWISLRRERTAPGVLKAVMTAEML